MTKMIKYKVMMIMKYKMMIIKYEMMRMMIKIIVPITSTRDPRFFKNIHTFVQNREKESKHSSNLTKSNEYRKLSTKSIFRITRGTNVRSAYRLESGAWPFYGEEFIWKRKSATFPHAIHQRHRHAAVIRGLKSSRLRGK